MKKFSLFLALICLITFFSGCSSEEYQLVKKSGNYYIKLNKQFESSATVDNAYVQELANTVRFDSMEEMINDIRNGSFTKEELVKISRFEADAAGNIQVCNLDTLYAPQLPSNYILYGIDWDGQNYCFIIQNGNTADPFFLQDESDWQERWEKELNWNTGVLRLDVTSTQNDPERNGTVYFYPYATYTPDGQSIEYANRKSCVYTFERNGNTFYICEDYDSDAPDAIPSNISIFGISQGQHFRIFLSKLEERPSIDWIAQFGLQVYSGSTVTK